MIEAYKIGVSLVMDTNVGGVLGPLMRDFNQLNKVVQDARDGTRQLSGTLKQMAAQGEAIRALAGNMERMAAAMGKMASAAPGAADAVSGMASRAAGMAGDFERAARAANDIRRGGPGPTAPGPRAAPLLLTWDGQKGPAGGALMLPPESGFGFGGGRQIPLDLGTGAPRERPSHSDLTQAGMAAAGVGWAGWELVKHGFAAAGEIGGLNARMANIGFTPAEMTQAYQAARQTQVNVPGVTIAQGMEEQLDAFTVLRNADEARGLLPALARAGVVLGQQGKGDAIHELFAAIQAGELKGKITDAQMGAFIQHVVNTSLVTGGRIGPNEVLSFIRNGGLAASIIGDGAQDALIPAMLSMDAKRAGTGLNALFQQFSAGRMSQGAMTLLEEMGLIVDPSKAQHIGLGMVRLDPGAMKPGVQDELRDNPVAFVRDVMIPALHDYDMNHYGRDDAALQATTAQQLASRIPGGNLLGDIIRLLSLSAKYGNAMSDAAGRDAFANQMALNPNVQLGGFNAAENALMVTLGTQGMGTAVTVLQNLTAGLNDLSKWSADHPDLSGTLTKIGAEMGLFAGGVATLALGTAAYMALAALSGPVGLIAGVGAGAIIAANGIELLDKKLHGWLPWLYRGADGKPVDGPGGMLDMIQKQGVQHPWWDPLYWGKHKDAAPGWVPRFGSDASAAPPPANGPRAAAGTADDPVHTVTTITNTGDIARGADAYSARQASRPPSGPTAPDTRLGLGYPGQFLP